MEGDLMSRLEFSPGRRRLAAIAIGAAAAAALSLSTAGTAFAAGSGGVTDEGVIYVDHTLYRTVATPTDLSRTGAPAQSWDVIYSFGGLQKSVAEVAPGDPGYNGGRWQVHAVSAPNGYAAALASGDMDDDGVLDAADEVWAALAAGDLVDNGVVKHFVCTLNRVP
jgi:hypothetical protein